MYGAMNRLLCVLGLAGLMTWVACSTVTETGRRQLLLVSDGEIAPMAINEFEKLKQATPVAKDAQANALLQRVGPRIAKVATLPEARWEFVLFDDPKNANAFCLPGGKVGVYIGILPVTLDEAGLATVLGHEIAHAAARHGAERMSEALLTQLGGQAFGFALRNQSAKTQNLVLGIYGLSSQVGWTLPHSRSHESEADRIGLRYMARAGYDPRAAVAFWKRFAAYNERSGGMHWEFLSTHPLDETRIKQLEQWMPEALAEMPPGARLSP